MTAKVRVERLGEGEAADRELDAFFDACPHAFAQQTRGWRTVIERLGEDEPMYLAARAGGRLVGVLPAYRFDGPLGAILNTVPQAGALGGVATAPDCDREAVYAALLEGYVALASETGCALASVIGNPIWPDGDLCARTFRPDFVLENECQVLDLAEALDANGELVGANSNVRRNLRTATNGELRIDAEMNAANVAEWHAIHAARHREIGAEPLPEALFQAALECMVPRGAAVFFFVRRTDDEEMVGGGFYVHHGAVIDAFMPSIRSDQSHLAPAFLLAIHSMRFAAAHGIRWYNWQASPPEGGVRRFKQQWGSRERRYAYFTRVTGDAGAFLASDPTSVRVGYRWHYALPFDRIGRPQAERGGTSSRADAWKSVEAGS